MVQREFLNQPHATPAFDGVFQSHAANVTCFNQIFAVVISSIRARGEHAHCQIATHAVEPGNLHIGASELGKYIMKQDSRWLMRESPIRGPMS